MEIERAPLITALLLEPFTLLWGKVAVASIKVEGGPISRALGGVAANAGAWSTLTEAMGGGHTQERRSRERGSNFQGLIADEGAY